MWWKCGGLLSVIASEAKQSQKEVVMLPPTSLLNLAVRSHTYIWVDVFLIKETPKAILIMFDDRKIWLPKTWIKKIKHSRHCKVISIRILEHCWTKKFQ